MTKIKDIFQSLYVDFNRLSPSVKFWHGVLFVILVLSAIFVIDLFLFLQIVMTVLAAAKGLGSEINENEDFWVIMCFGTWFLAFLFLIGYLIYLLYQATIGKFNNWLNSRK